MPIRVPEFLATAALWLRVRSSCIQASSVTETEKRRIIALGFAWVHRRRSNSKIRQYGWWTNYCNTVLKLSEHFCKYVRKHPKALCARNTCGSRYLEPSLFRVFADRFAKMRAKFQQSVAIICPVHQQFLVILSNSWLFCDSFRREKRRRPTVS